MTIFVSPDGIISRWNDFRKKVLEPKHIGLSERDRKMAEMGFYAGAYSGINVGQRSKEEIAASIKELDKAINDLEPYFTKSYPR